MLMRSKLQGTAKPHTEVRLRSYQQEADVVSPWVGEGFAPISLNTSFCRERRNPKGNFHGRAAHEQEVGIQGIQSVVEPLHRDICLRVEMVHPGDKSPGDPLPFPTAREEAENKQKGGELSFIGLQMWASPRQRTLGCNRFA